MLQPHGGIEGKVLLVNLSSSSPAVISPVTGINYNPTEITSPRPTRQRQKHEAGENGCPERRMAKRHERQDGIFNQATIAF